MDGLIDKVLKQIETDVSKGDFTALEELLQYVPVNILTGFLSDLSEEV